MRVKMNVFISGTRNGAYWPEVGGEIDLSEPEALELVEAGKASPVTVPPKVERAVAAAAEKRAPGRPRKSEA